MTCIIKKTYQTNVHTRKKCLKQICIKSTHYLQHFFAIYYNIKWLHCIPSISTKSAKNVLFCMLHFLIYSHNSIWSAKSQKQGCYKMCMLTFQKCIEHIWELENLTLSNALEQCPQITATFKYCYWRSIRFLSLFKRMWNLNCFYRSSTTAFLFIF